MMPREARPAMSSRADQQVIATATSAAPAMRATATAAGASSDPPTSSRVSVDGAARSARPAGASTIAVIKSSAFIFFSTDDRPDRGRRRGV